MHNTSDVGWNRSLCGMEQVALWDGTGRFVGGKRSLTGEPLAHQAAPYLKCYEYKEKVQADHSYMCELCDPHQAYCV